MSDHWKRHPEFEDLEIKADGSELKFNGKLLNIKDRKGKTGKILKTVYFKKSYYSVPKLILETYSGKMPEGRHYATYKDSNIENLHPNNLYWSKTHHITKERKFENDLKLSKLTKDQTYSALVSHSKGIPISNIAKNYKVSDMTVYRAIQRLKRKLQK
ncbi:helix-turn-helix domain-containing protein [Christiangramia sediminis]|uniref:Helix-turn-helix domain-containing protein n=1 Tax=Christiangramia sediminis TaxID=2881336 RepID=A0A9X1LJA5_9FLAO|nr:helix-turn-helix domain-containing protein [Christiangramia sediminis]MCB7481393.1 helix-turn-helix domain-containing protein [Christiangramia sediminis]